MTTKVMASPHEKQKNQQHHDHSTATTTAGEDVVAADASFLESVDTPVLELHRSNVLRIETQQLLDECVLDVTPHHGHHDTVKWAWSARSYVDTIRQILQGMKPTSNMELQNYPFRHTLQSDKYGPTTSSTDTKLPFMGGSKLVMKSTGSCNDYINGWTTSSGNANVIPIMDYVVQLPVTNNSNNNTKEYMKHRYFDVRNRTVHHIAQHLSHKKYKHLIGTVEYKWTNSGRKLNLLLTPPTIDTNNPSQEESNKKKSKKNNKNKDYQPVTKKQKTSTTKKLRFRVQLVFGYTNMDWIPSSRLFPHRSNLGTTTTSSEAGGGVLATPYYNYDLTQDGIIETCVLEEESSDGSIPSNLSQTLILLKVWCLQHGFLRGHDTFTTTHLMLLLWYLYQTRKVTPRMSSLQVFTVVLKFLQETTFVDTQGGTSSDNTEYDESSSKKAKKTATKKKNHRTALIMPLPNHTETQTIAASAQHALYQKCHVEETNTPATLVECFLHYTTGPVFLDSTLKHNYWGRISSNFITCLQQCATQTLCIGMRDARVQHPFSYIFMETHRFWNAHDVYVRIPLKDIDLTGNTTTKKWWPQEETNHHHPHIYKADIGTFEYIQHGLLSMLHQALGDRIKRMRILTTGNGRIGSGGNSNSNSSSSSGSDEIPYYKVRGGDSDADAAKSTMLQSPTGDSDLVLGIELNPDTASRIVDRGPPANDTKGVEAFVQLWGSQKAQLRRFKDGAIVHAVVWNTAETPQDETSTSLANDDKTQGSIVECIVQHILKLHFFKQQTHKSDAENKKKKKKKNVTVTSTTFTNVQFELRNMLSLVEGVKTTDESNPNNRYLTDSTFAHRQAMNAFDSLSEFLRQHSRQTIPIEGSLDAKRSRLGIPLTIDGVEPLSASLRYSEVFPPLPHTCLGHGAGVTVGGKHSKNKVTGAIMSEPIKIQIRFGSSSKWPTDLRAMGAAKTAMLIQLADGIEHMDGTKYGFATSNTFHVTPNYMDIGYKGYSWRIYVRADPELKMLRDLRKPSAEALQLLRTLTKDHVIAAMHHSTIHKVHTEHPSSSSVVRLAKRWVASHMLSDLIPSEAIELLVAKVYNDWDTPLETPSSVSNGFIRFLKLLSTHDWARQPLIVDPQGHISDDDRTHIMARFESIRGPNQDKGPAMYIISPNDRQGDIEVDESSLAITGSTPAANANVNKAPTLQHIWVPSFTMENPEWVILSRAKALAKRSHDYLMDLLIQGGDAKASSSSRTSKNDTHSNWSAIFQETTTSLKSFSALMRVDPEFVVDHECSSTTGNTGHFTKNESDGTLESSYTQSLRKRYLGPKVLRRRVYRNLDNDDANGTLMDWTPIQQMVKSLRHNFGSLALFFYNEQSPDIIAMLWRPTAFASQSLSVMHSEYKRPASTNDQDWSKDSLVLNNAQDILRELSRWTKDIILGTKVLDTRPIISMSRRQQLVEEDRDDSEEESSSNTKKRKMKNEEDSDDDNNGDSASSDDDSDDDST